MAALITFSAPKTVSTLWALGDDHVAGESLAAHDAAVQAVLDFVERHATTRATIGGVVQNVDADGVVVAAFRQHTSRSLDPQLHTHAIVVAKVRIPDGRWLALDARLIKHDQRTLSSLYHATLRSELTARLGVLWQVPKDGIAEIDGMPEQVLDELSQRTRQVAARLERKLDRFPLALMHGDLHSRNIMIRVAKQEGVARRDADLTFKLIDFESVSQSGDAAHDAGQLLVDLNLLSVSTRRSLNRQVVQKLEIMQHQVEDAYLDFASTRGDTTFPLRLELARARALIRIAKGQTKRSEAFQKDREFQRVLDELVEVIHLVEAATIHLKHVAAALEGE